jgi:serine-type D-Ala-D-Ala carboxypeptidase/endopeptidase (penicillin-binding protein 4)
MHGGRLAVTLTKTAVCGLSLFPESTVNQRRTRCRTLLLFLVLMVTCSVNQATAADSTLMDQLHRWVDRGSVMLNDESSHTLLAYNADDILVPASIIKIYAAMVALDILGEQFVFKTGFYQDADGNLGIKGWGDPQLISEEIHSIADKLKMLGVTKIKQIQLDQTAFAPSIDINGRSNSLNPYDAINGALVVNFNTLFLGRKKDGTIYSAESVTPLTPLARVLGRSLKPGTQDRFNLSTRQEYAHRYAGELFGEILKGHGVTVEQSDVGQTVIDDRWSLIIEHHSSVSLQEVIRGLLKYSNNFIANQIFLVTGAEQKGYPATTSKARSVFQAHFNQQFHEENGQTIINEASGISRKNRMSARTMMAVLERFRPWADLLDHKKGAWVKSGTLTGVYNFAGYIKTADGYRPFVILLNQQKNMRDRVLKQLIQYGHQY